MSNEPQHQTRKASSRGDREHVLPQDWNKGLPVITTLSQPPATDDNPKDWQDDPAKVAVKIGEAEPCGEQWTVEWLRTTYNQFGFSGIMVAHEAALADAYKKGEKMKPQAESCNRPTWTPEWLANYGSAENWLQEICDAHESALVAERKKYSDAEILFDLQQKCNNDLNQQLLQAQAAIVEHNKQDRCYDAISSDLSALDKHDAKLREMLENKDREVIKLRRELNAVRKPLVDALEQTAERFRKMGLGTLTIEAVLAKVKE